MANKRTFWTYPSGTQGLVSEAMVVDAHVYALATNGPSDGLAMLATPPCPPASLRFTPRTTTWTPYRRRHLCLNNAHGLSDAATKIPLRRY